MRGVVIGFLCALTCAGVAIADLGSVVDSWELPGYQIAAVAVSDSEVFISSVFGYHVIYVCNRTTGSLTKSLPGGPYYYGLTYSSGGHLWIVDTRPYIVFDVDAKNGSILNTWRVPNQYHYGLAALCTGDGGLNTTHIITAYSHTADPRVYYRLPSNGSITASHSISNAGRDIAYDWRNRLVWAGGIYPNEKTVYGFSTTGSLVASFSAPNIGIRGAGYYGEYLYVTDAMTLYVIHCPGNLCVTPSSLGKVKALFR